MLKRLTNLKPDEVQRNLTIIKEMVRELDPDLPIDRGPFHDLVMYYAAVFTTANQREIADVMRTMNLGKLIQDPAAASNKQVDRILNNWMMKRLPGMTARGQITLVLNKPFSFVVPPGTKFHAGAHVFKTRATYQVRAHGIKLSEYDRILVEKSKDTWTVNIPVVSVTTGAASNLRRGTRLTFDNDALPYVHNVYADADFKGGTDEETNAQMFKRMTRSVGGKVWSNRLTNNALIHKQPEFERVIGISTVGFGDPEMIRDQHSLWPGSTGGRTDVYIKMSSNILTKEVALQGQLVNRTHEGLLWEIDVGKDIAPGFYYVASVLRVGGRPCVIKKDLRGFDTGDAAIPDIKEPLEAVYSAFQTTKLQVLEQESSSGTKTEKFTVDFRYLDGIDELQKFLSRRDVGSPASDILVKAPIPCFTTVILEIQRQPYDAQIRTGAIKEAVTAMINNTGFTGRLPSTMIVNAVLPYLTGGMLLKEVKLSGKIRYPDGRLVNTNEMITIPNEPHKLVSARTVTFFQDPADVHVRVMTVDDA